jgi:hypothetical protein
MLKSAPVKSPTHWSANFILYEEADPKNREDLWALPLTGDRKPMLVLGDSFSEQKGRLSPDEKWIAYVSDRDRYERGVRPEFSSVWRQVAAFEQRGRHPEVAQRRQGALLLGVEPRDHVR